MVQAPQTWATGATGSGAMVCIIDSGLYTGHEDFQGANIIGGAPNGWDSDTCGHGTHVAGTVAAVNNTAGVVGVSPDVDLYIVQVFDGPDCGWSFSSTLVDAALLCRDAGADIISMSLGGSFSSNSENNAFEDLFNQGLLSIAAAGNGGNTQFSYPASYDSVVSVAAVDSNKNLASFSQRNNQVELAGPGVSVLSTVPWSSPSAVVNGSSYLVSAMEGTPQTSASGTAVDGGLCTDSGGGAFNGAVVMCERGDISFADKVLNVQAGGGSAAVVYNNVAGGFSGTLGGAATAIPSVSMSQEDGQFIVANDLGTAAAVDTRTQSPGSGYEAWDGTSMATPHVSGVAALVWSANPMLTNQQVRDILASTAEDLGSAGRDNDFGWGLVQAFDAVAAATGTDPGPDPTTVTTQSVNVSVTTRGRNSEATANVVVSAGGVQVDGCFSGAVNVCGSGTADASGAVTFDSGKYRNSGSVTFCVTNVTGSNVTFQPGANDCGTSP